jgi:hypothetical protein
MIRVTRTNAGRTLIRGDKGYILFETDPSDTPQWITATAVGYIGVSMVAADYRLARAFADGPGQCPWTYTADVRSVTALNPLNIVYLLRVARLKRLQQYRVVVEPGSFRGNMLKLLAPIVRATVVSER